MLSLRKWERRATVKCLTAVLALILWLASQTIQFTFGPIYSNMSLAIVLSEGGYLLLAAMWIVINNTARAIVLYGGWFLLSDGLAELLDSGRSAWILPPAAIPVSYFGMSFLHFPSVPHFGVPAVITLTSVWLLQYISHDVRNAGYKFAILAVVVFSIQWLDLLPVLTPYGFGWGELSFSVKNISLLMEKDYLLDVVCGLAFAFSALVAVLMTKLFVSYEKQLRQLQLLRQRDRELSLMRTEQARLRLYQEMQYLVHDLKRPLTTVFGLADLLSISPDEATSNHSRAILSAAEKMDQMIGEIKNPDSVHEARVEEIINYTMAQVRALPWGASVSLDVPERLMECSLMLNVIRFSRVLVNLLDNARHATENLPSPLISLGVKAAGCGLTFIVDDNGPGFIEPEDGKKSSWGSSGLGLDFVRNAVTGFGGTLGYERRAKGGLRCMVWIPYSDGRENGIWR